MVVVQGFEQINEIMEELLMRLLIAPVDAEYKITVHQCLGMLYCTECFNNSDVSRKGVVVAAQRMLNKITTHLMKAARAPERKAYELSAALQSARIELKTPLFRGNADIGRMDMENALSGLVAWVSGVLQVKVEAGLQAMETARMNSRQMDMLGKMADVVSRQPRDRAQLRSVGNYQPAKRTKFEGPPALQQMIRAKGGSVMPMPCSFWARGKSVKVVITNT